MDFEVPLRSFLVAPGRLGFINLGEDAWRTGTNMSHPGKRKIIFKHALGGDMLVPRRFDIAVQYGLIYLHAGLDLSTFIQVG